MTDFSEITYLVDARDRIVSVSPQWTEFAVRNAGDRLSQEDIVGRSLWDFIADDATRALYREILKHVRAGETTDLVLRCDAPERRRLIEMIVRRLPEGTVEFKTVLLASKSRPAQRLFDRSTPRTAGHVMVCSWCDRVCVAAESWLEVEAAMEELHLSEEAELPAIEPVVCPACYAKVIELLAAAKPAAA